MIDRYTRPEMGRIWSLQNRFECLLKVEKALAQAQAALKIIPQDAAEAIVSKGRFDVKSIASIEKTTRHDVIAFVTDVARKVGLHGRYVHFGLTSSDALDTGLSLQILQAWKSLDHRLAGLEKTLKALVKKYVLVPCAGRTHGIHAEPTTLGLKFAGHLAELQRNRERVEEACEQAAVVKLSGAVGTYSSLGPQVEHKVGEILGLPHETVATQVVPRDRHAEIFCSLALLGAGFERLALEVRHLQRTEVGELEEPFQEGQKGSSAMPHKKNPIGSENVSGLARLLRGYMVSGVENVALWHERDISHSSVERVIFPDAFIVADYMAYRLDEILSGVKVHQDRMKSNLQLTSGQIFSSHVLLALIKKGMSREEAYKLVQKNAHSLKNGQSLEDVLAKDKAVKKLLSRKDLAHIFSGRSHRNFVKEVVERVL